MFGPDKSSCCSCCLKETYQLQAVANLGMICGYCAPLLGLNLGKRKRNRNQQKDKEEKGEKGGSRSEVKRVKVSQQQQQQLPSPKTSPLVSLDMDLYGWQDEPLSSEEEKEDQHQQQHSPLVRTPVRYSCVHKSPSAVFSPKSPLERISYCADCRRDFEDVWSQFPSTPLKRTPTPRPPQQPPTTQIVVPKLLPSPPPVLPSAPILHIQQPVSKRQMIDSAVNTNDKCTLL